MPTPEFSRRRLFSLIPLPFVAAPASTPEPSVFVVPDPDPLAVAAERYSRELGTLASCRRHHDGLIAGARHRPDVIAVLERAHDAMRDSTAAAERNLLALMRARGKTSVVFGGRTFRDQPVAVTADCPARGRQSPAISSSPAT